MEQPPSLLDQGLDVEQVIGDLLEFEFSIRQDQIPQPGNLLKWASYRQNISRIRYCAEYRNLNIREWDSDDGYYHIKVWHPDHIPQEQLLSPEDGYEPPKEIEYEEVDEPLECPGCGRRWNGKVCTICGYEEEKNG